MIFRPAGSIADVVALDKVCQCSEADREGQRLRGSTATGSCSSHQCRLLPARSPWRNDPTCPATACESDPYQGRPEPQMASRATGGQQLLAVHAYKRKERASDGSHLPRNRLNLGLPIVTLLLCTRLGDRQAILVADDGDAPAAASKAACQRRCQQPGPVSTARTHPSSCSALS
jgi:hypothetical protein